jgi:hypothetical protein
MSDPSLQPLGRILLAVGLLLTVAGALLLLAGRWGLPRLPGDIVVHRGRWTFFAPFGWMLLLSLLLTLLLNLLSRR